MVQSFIWEMNFAYSLSKLLNDVELPILGPGMLCVADLQTLNRSP